MAKDESKKRKDDAALPAAAADEKGGKGKKGKKAKKEKGEKKPVSAVAMFFICFLLFLLFLVACFAVLNFNWFNLRTQAIVLLAEGASPYENERKELTELQLQVEDQLAQIELEKEQNQKLLDQIAKDQEALAAEEIRIGEQRDEVNDLFEAYYTRTMEFDQLVAIYDTMDASKAAQALSLLENIDDIARLMSALKKDQAAKILNSMDASLAASVTQRMLP